MMKILLRTLAAGTVILAGSQAMAQEKSTSTAELGVSVSIVEGCTINVDENINFGRYSALPGDVDKEGKLTVTCSTAGSTPSLALNGGQSALTSARAMKNLGSDTLKYQLFKDSARTQPWGDTGAEVVNITMPESQKQELFIYGRLYSMTGQGEGAKLVPGDYRDTITATLEY